MINWCRLLWHSITKEKLWNMPPAQPQTAGPAAASEDGRCCLGDVFNLFGVLVISEHRSQTNLPIRRAEFSLFFTLCPLEPQRKRHVKTNLCILAESLKPAASKTVTNCQCVTCVTGRRFTVWYSLVASCESSAGCSSVPITCATPENYSHLHTGVSVRNISVLHLNRDRGQGDPIVRLMWGGKFSQKFCECQKEPDTLSFPSCSSFNDKSASSSIFLQLLCFSMEQISFHTSQLFLCYGIWMLTTPEVTCGDIC